MFLLSIFPTSLKPFIYGDMKLRAAASELLLMATVKANSSVGFTGTVTLSFETQVLLNICHTTVAEKYRYENPKFYMNKLCSSFYAIEV